MTERHCSYCGTANPDDHVGPVVSTCPVHGSLRESYACAACIPDPSARSAGVYVHQVPFLGPGCPERVVLVPREEARL